MVRVDELILAVNIALERTAVDECRAGDQNGNGRISVDELVTSVNHALSGCPAATCPANGSAIGCSAVTGSASCNACCAGAGSACTFTCFRAIEASCDSPTQNTACDDALNAAGCGPACCP